MKYEKEKNTLNSVWIQYQAQMDIYTDSNYIDYSQLNGNLWEPEQRRRPNLISSNSIGAIQFHIDFPIVKRAFKTSPEHVTCYNPRASCTGTYTGCSDETFAYSRTILFDKIY